MRIDVIYRVIFKNQSTYPVSILCSHKLSTFAFTKRTVPLTWTTFNLYVFSDYFRITNYVKEEEPFFFMIMSIIYDSNLPSDIAIMYSTRPRLQHVIETSMQIRYPLHYQYGDNVNPKKSQDFCCSKVFLFLTIVSYTWFVLSDHSLISEGLLAISKKELAKRETASRTLWTILITQSNWLGSHQQYPVSSALADF